MGEPNSSPSPQLPQVVAFDVYGDALVASKYPQALDWLRARALEYLPDDADALPLLQESLV